MSNVRTITRLLVVAQSVSILCLSQTALAQFHSATVLGSYSTALTKRLGVAEARGWGGGLELQLDVTDQIGIQLTGLYEYSLVDQPNALDQWNWDFWIQRYRGIVQANLASDPNLSATLTPDVTMEAIPVYLSGSYAFEPLPGLSVRPYAGAGIYFYTKKLYLVEQWNKYFPDVQYTLSYEYRNFAPPKSGNPFLAVAGLKLSYRLSPMMELAGGVRYLQLLGSATSRGYAELPMENTLSIQFGLGFVY